MEITRVGDADLGFSDSWQIDETGQRIGDSYKFYTNGIEPGAFDESFVLDGETFLKRFLAVKNVILNVSSVVFRKDALTRELKKAGDSLFDFGVAGDWQLYVNICLSGGRIAYEARPLNGHRRHLSSVTHSLKVKRHLDEIKEIQALVKKHVKLERAQLAAQEEHRKQAEEHLATVSETQAQPDAAASATRAGTGKQNRTAR